MKFHRPPLSPVVRQGLRLWKGWQTLFFYALRAGWLSLLGTYRISIHTLAEGDVSSNCPLLGAYRESPCLGLLGVRARQLRVILLEAAAVKAAARVARPADQEARHADFLRLPAAQFCGDLRLDRVDLVGKGGGFRLKCRQRGCLLRQLSVTDFPVHGSFSLRLIGQGAGGFAPSVIVTGRILFSPYAAFLVSPCGYSRLPSLNL